MMCLLQQESAWSTFKSHSVLGRASDAWQDFGCHWCHIRHIWYINQLPSLLLEEAVICNISSTSRIWCYVTPADVRYAEVQKMFFKHVRTNVLEMSEPRTLQDLLLDYNNLMRDFGLSKSLGWTHLCAPTAIPHSLPHPPHTPLRSSILTISNLVPWCLKLQSMFFLLVLSENYLNYDYIDLLYGATRKMVWFTSAKNECLCWRYT